MARPRFRFFSVLLFSAAIAICVWKYLPSTRLDRGIFTFVVRTYANPPFIISGTGSHSEPWLLRLLSSSNKPDPAATSLVISLGDDSQGIFQSSPPSPVDLAVILKNIRRLGASRLAISPVLAWEKPDPIALTALDLELGRFSSIVTAAPLGRGTNASPLPSAFRRASLPLTTIRGDVSRLPLVNRTGISSVILGGENAIAGFTHLEHQNIDGPAPLLARWEDRAVLAFPLLTVLNQRGLPIEGVQIDLGKFIKLGANGPVIPIDNEGRIAVTIKKLKAVKTIAVENLIDRDEPLPIISTAALLLRDDQSTSGFETRDFSNKLAPLIAAISSDAGLGKTRSFARLNPAREIRYLICVCFMLGILARASSLPREIGFGLLAGFLIIVHFVSVSGSSTLPPTVPALSAIAGAFLLSRFFFKNTAPAFLTKVAREPGPEPYPNIAPPEADPGPAGKEPATRRTPAKSPSPARKSPPKKAAKKAETVKKTAAKKTARTKKKPPAGS